MKVTRRLFESRVSGTSALMPVILAETDGFLESELSFLLKDMAEPSVAKSAQNSSCVKVVKCIFKN